MKREFTDELGNGLSICAGIGAGVGAGIGAGTSARTGTKRITNLGSYLNGRQLIYKRRAHT